MSGRERVLAEFASMVRRCREEAGYASARRFFEALGGSSFFGCTSKAYINLENGAGVPQPRLVEKIVAGLRLAIGGRRARDFAAAYLRLIFAEEDFHAMAIKALSGPARTRRARKAPKLSARQQELLASGSREDLLFEHPVFLRAPEGELTREYFPYLERSLKAAARAAGGAQDGELFVLEAEVVKLLPF